MIDVKNSLRSNIQTMDEDSKYSDSACTYLLTFHLDFMKLAGFLRVLNPWWQNKVSCWGQVFRWSQRSSNSGVDGLTSEERSVDVRGAARFPPAPTSLDVGQRHRHRWTEALTEAQRHRHCWTSDRGDRSRRWSTTFDRDPGDDFSRRLITQSRRRGPTSFQVGDHHQVM